MNKKMMVWALALGCLVTVTGVAGAASKKAASAPECKVESVEGSKVVLDCAATGKNLVAGATVTLKVKAAAAAKPAVAPAKPAAEATPPAATTPATPAEPATPAKPVHKKKKIEGC